MFSGEISRICHGLFSEASRTFPGHVLEFCWDIFWELPGNFLEFFLDYWKVTGRVDFKILISNFWPLGEGFRGFRPQIRLQHAKISMLTSFEVIWLQLKGFPKFCPVAFQ